MKEINSYIIEKLHINKDTKIGSLKNNQIKTTLIKFLDWFYGGEPGDFYDFDPEDIVDFFRPCKGEEFKTYDNIIKYVKKYENEIIVVTHKSSSYGNIVSCVLPNTNDTFEQECMDDLKEFKKYFNNETN